MTLLVITIAGSALAVAANRSCRATLQASAAMEDLQVRWGATSCRELMMFSAEWMLVQDARGDRAPSPTSRKSITLGGMQFDLIFSDEQAKANVNALAKTRNEPDLAHSLISVQKDLMRISAIRLSPAELADDNPDTDQLQYASFDQVLAAPRPEDLISIDRFARSAGDRITCWSNGKVNFKRADRQVLREALVGVFNETQLNELIKYRDRSPDCTLLEALDSIEMQNAEETIGKAMTLLTDMSLCHGLWVIARGKTRCWYSLHVRRRSDGRHWSFQW